MRKRRVKKKNIMIMLLVLIFLLSFSMFLFKDIFIKDPNDTPVELNKNDTNGSLSLLMVGDVLIHGAIYNDAIVEANKYNFSYIFDDVKYLFKNYDLMFYNQESIIGGKSLGLSSYPRFNSPEEIGDAMTNLGFNLVSLANNHTLDKGEKGITNSINYWNNKDVITSGSYISEADRIKDNIKEVNGIKYTLLSYTTTTNGLSVPSSKEYLVNVYSDEKVKNDIERVKDKVDLIIVSMHWGEEYNSVPTTKEREIANYLSTLGVNIVVGHHPHVLQPVEQINNTLVFYSLGNFLSAQDTTDKLTGAIAKVDIKVSDIDNKKSIAFTNVKTDLVYTYSNNDSNFKIIPYEKLTTKELPGYKDIYTKYKNILSSEYKGINITEIGD